MQEITKKVIEELLEEKEGPYISIYMPTVAAASIEVKKMPIQLKNLLNLVKKELQEKQKMSVRNIEKLLEPATKLLGDRVFWQNQKQGLAIFISSGYFQYFMVNSTFPERSTVSTYFNIIPLISEIMFNDNFYILALSRNKNRIFLATRGNITQLDIEGIPESLQEISQFTVSEKSLASHPSGKKGTGAVFHGVGEIDSEKREELLQYFRQIDQGLNKYLNKNHKSPLIIMSVKDLVPIYLEVNSYPYLLKETIEGNPDECTPDIIHKNALPIASDYFHSQLDNISSSYHNLKGTGKTSTQLEDVVSAAYFSRVEQLFIKSNTSQIGYFDPEENRVYLTEESWQLCDLYNLAAIKTISNGGQVFLLDEEKMPDGEDIIAFYRF